MDAEGVGVDDPSYALITGWARTVADVGAALNIAPAFASRMVTQADALDTRLPRMLDLLARNQVDWADVKTIIARTELVDAEKMPELDAALAAKVTWWQCWSRRRLCNAVDAAIHQLDPEGANERRVRADTNRRVSMTPLPNGMARLNGYVPAPVGVVFDKRVADMATMVCRDDPRTLDQRRVDAIEALGHGTFTLACTCGRDECPADKPDTAAVGGVQIVLNVVAPADTVTGRSDAPGYLDGYGVIDAVQVRNLADKGAVLRSASAAAATDTAVLGRHQPSAAQARWVRSRSLTCSFPGCNRSAWRADLDHTDPFDHDYPMRGGWTWDPNLDPKCRTHHLMKTFDCGWRTAQFIDGTIEWTSPEGRVYRSTPDGAELFEDIAHALPKPRRRNPRREKAKRIAAARAGMAAKRAANEETRYLNRERAREIDGRQWRNSVRFKLFLFKGKPSTSPFANWVNDPDEDEHITADWKPPPLPPSSTTRDDEPPPF